MSKKMLTAAEKQLREQEKLRRSWPRLAVPSDYTGEMIHVNRRIYEGVLKKVNVLSMKAIGGSGGKLVIEYQPRHGRGRGTLELLDIGPPPIQ